MVAKLRWLANAGQARWLPNDRIAVSEVDTPAHADYLPSPDHEGCHGRKTPLDLGKPVLLFVATGRMPMLW